MPAVVPRLLPQSLGLGVQKIWRVCLGKNDGLNPNELVSSGRREGVGRGAHDQNKADSGEDCENLRASPVSRGNLQPVIAVKETYPEDPPPISSRDVHETGDHRGESGTGEGLL